MALSMWTQSQRPKLESDFHHWLASLEQLLNCLVPWTPDSQMDNNNIDVT